MTRNRLPIGLDPTAKRTESLDPATEDLLWQLSTLPSQPPAKGPEPPIDDELLERYRRGKPLVEERRSFERRLAGDERALERLARHAPKSAYLRRPASRLAASILVGALATAGIFYSLRLSDGSSTASPGVPPYDVAVYGLADRREGETSPGTSPETRPGSTVRIVARPASAAHRDAQFALYRRVGSGSLVRIPDVALHVQVERCTAVLEAEASALVGTEPGLHELLLLIAPDGFPTPASVARSQLHELVHRGARVHAFELRLLPATERS